jgi:hypothetical protein
MKKAMRIVLVLLAVIAAPVSAQVGIGLTAGYPVGYAVFYQENYGMLPDPAPLFWGATVKWKPSGVLLESGLGFWTAGSATLTYGYIDLGAALDLWILRLGIAGGIDVVNASAPGYPSESAIGLSAKPSLDLKLGPVTVGVSMAFPIDIIVSILRQEEGGVYAGDNFLRIFAGHASLNVVYWFGSEKKAG